MTAHNTKYHDGPFKPVGQDTLALYDKKYHDGPFKTVGQAALALDQGLPQDVGETAEGMAPYYDREMRKVLEKHKDLKRYYFIVFRKKELMHPQYPMRNVMRQWFVAPCMFKPRARDIKKYYPLHDHDVWLVENGDPQHQWALPGPDAWDTILKNKRPEEKDLIKWMLDYERGVLK